MFNPLPSFYAFCLSLSVFSAIGVSAGPSGAASQTFPTGSIIERVACVKDATQSYALYLPSGYTPERQWPIIYAFDPAARGSLPVKLYREAAEKYGYIVAGSHNSRNGPGVPLNNIIQTLWDDTHSRLAVDDRRVYLTGFSGGARVASMAAYANPGRVAGILLHGAGFHSQSPLTKGLPFVVYGLAGAEDFNYFELKQLDRALADAGVAHRLRIFEGGHAWAAAGDCTAAVEWLELHAIRSGSRTRDEAIIDASLGRAVAEAQAAESAHDFMRAAAAYEALAADYRGLRDVKDFEQKAAAIKASQPFKDDLKREKAEEQFFQRRSREFVALLQQLRRREEHDAAMADAKRTIAALQKQASDENAESDRRGARRLLALYSVTVREEAAQQQYSKNFRDLIDSLVLANELRPGQPQTLYQLAAAYALSGEKREAIETLKRAVEKGWDDAGEIARNPAFDSIRGERAYRQLLETIPAKPATQDGKEQ
jgi:dienelactone hydrolase